MQGEKYRGYVLWGHALLQQEDIPQAERYAASGTINRDTKVIEASGVLDTFVSEEEADAAVPRVGPCVGLQPRLTFTRNYISHALLIRRDNLNV
ncbi:hypothetical protein PMI06_004826 [Burkholderia sp. BT03]|nr:hypothetical protein PMI06_004826 [Burkholderia sp. BT03]SKC77530.1 hypothetical protein SAMN06266956_3104 [Paraburkholderia hospita]